MSLIKSIVWLAGLMLFSISVYGQESLSALDQKADSLYEQNKDESALELYQKVIQDDPDNFEALWRTSFLYSRIGNRFEDEENQKEYFGKAEDWAEKALKVDSLHTQSNLVMSVAMGRKAIIASPRERVAASRAIKKYADRALQIDSTNAGAWHVLGRWNFEVANLGWMEKAAVNTLFGGLPGDPSNEKAAEYIEKAIALNSSHLLYYYDLARVYKVMKKDEQAVSTCEEILDAPNNTPDDEQIKEDCQKLIEEIQ